MKKGRKIKGYIYCSIHDIYYSEERKKEVEEKNQKLRKKLSRGAAILASQEECPCCESDSQKKIRKILSRPVDTCQMKNPFLS